MTMGRRRVRVLAVLAFALLGCAGHQAFDPWLVPRDSFLAGTDTIALSPLGLPDALEQPDPVQATFDSLITDALRAAGFVVVPSDIASDIWNHGADSIGGYYDPMTGDPDTSKLNPLRRYFKRRLRQEHGADAVLFPEVVVVDAPYSGGSAAWDGASQSVAGFFRVLLSAIDGTDLPAGTADGLSLDVQIEGTDDGAGAVFDNRGGIELWSKPNRDGSRLDQVPREKLFVDRERLRKSVRIALRSLLQGEERAPR